MGFWKLIWFDLKVRSVGNNMPNCPELVHTRFGSGHLCAKLQTILYRSTSLLAHPSRTGGPIFTKLGM